MQVFIGLSSGEPNIEILNEYIVGENGGKSESSEYKNHLQSFLRLIKEKCNSGNVDLPARTLFVNYISKNAKVSKDVAHGVANDILNKPENWINDPQRGYVLVDF